MKKKLIFSILIISSLLVGCTDSEENIKDEEVDKEPVEFLVENKSIKEEDIVSKLIEFQQGNLELNEDFTRLSLNVNISYPFGEEVKEQVSSTGVYPKDEDSQLYVTASKGIVEIDPTTEGYEVIDVEGDVEVHYNKSSNTAFWNNEEKDTSYEILYTSETTKEDIVSTVEEFLTSEKNSKFELIDKEVKYPTLLTEGTKLNSIMLTKTDTENLDVRYDLEGIYELKLTVNNDEHNYYSENAEQLSLYNNIDAFFEDNSDEEHTNLLLAWEEEGLKYYLSVTADSKKSINEDKEINKDKLVEIANSFE